MQTFFIVAAVLAVAVFVVWALISLFSVVFSLGGVMSVLGIVVLLILCS